MEVDNFISEMRYALLDAEQLIGKDLKSVGWANRKGIEEVISLLEARKIFQDKDEGYLRKLHINIVANTDYRVKSFLEGDPKAFYVVNAFPGISPALYIHLVVKFGLLPFVGELILFGCEPLVADVAKSIEDLYKYLQPYDVLIFCKTVLRSLYKRLKKLVDRENDNVRAGPTFFSLQNSMLRNYDEVGGSSLGVRETRIFNGHRFYHLITLLKDFTVFLSSPEEQDENVSSVYYMNVRRDYIKLYELELCNVNILKDCYCWLKDACLKHFQEFSVYHFITWNGTKFNNDVSLRAAISDGISDLLLCIEKSPSNVKEVFDQESRRTLSCFFMPSNASKKQGGGVMDIISGLKTNFNEEQMKNVLKSSEVFTNPEVAECIKSHASVLGFDLTKELVLLVHHPGNEPTDVNKQLLCETMYLSLKQLISSDLLNMLQMVMEQSSLKDYINLGMPELINDIFEQAYKIIRNKDDWDGKTESVDRMVREMALSFLCCPAESLFGLIFRCLEESTETCNLILNILKERFMQLCWNTSNTPLGDQGNMPLLSKVLHSMILNNMKSFSSKQMSNFYSVFARLMECKLVAGEKLVTHCIVQLLAAEKGDKDWKKLELCVQLLAQFFKSPMSAEIDPLFKQSVALLLGDTLEEVSWTTETFNDERVDLRVLVVDLLQKLLDDIQPSDSVNSVFEEHLRGYSQITASYFYYRVFNKDGDLTVEDFSGFLSLLHLKGQEDIPRSKYNDLVFALAKVLSCCTYKEIENFVENIIHKDSKEDEISRTLFPTVKDNLSILLMIMRDSFAFLGLILHAKLDTANPDCVENMLNWFGHVINMSVTVIKNKCLPLLEGDEILSILVCIISYIAVIKTFENYAIFPYVYNMYQFILEIWDVVEGMKASMRHYYESCIRRICVALIILVDMQRNF